MNFNDRLGDALKIAARKSRTRERAFGSAARKSAGSAQRKRGNHRRAYFFFLPLSCLFFFFSPGLVSTEIPACRFLPGGMALVLICTCLISRHVTSLAPALTQTAFQPRSDSKRAIIQLTRDSSGFYLRRSRGQIGLLGRYTARLRVTARFSS